MSMRKILSLILVVTLVSSVAVPLNVLPLPVVSASPSPQQLPRVALAKLWNITHIAYMAKFVDEKYVVVFELHGDVSLDGRFISSRKTAWVYKIDTGELLTTLTPDTDDTHGDTWEVISWEPFQYQKVYDRQGFFSADSKRMTEDARWIGTNGKVVDTTSWTTIPIDWGFTDTDGSHFYAVQLDYSGSILAVGYIGATDTNDTSKLLVYRYDPAQGKYVKAFEHVEYGDYGRRLQMTLDGKIIAVGGRFYGYLDIFRYDEDAETYVRVVHYRLPDPAGIGSLGMSDPYNVGYIVAGTLNGWVIIAHYDPDTSEFKVIYQNKDAPDDSWLYNPFYERWIPKVTEVFALCSHRDSSRPGYAIIYDVLTNQTVVIHFADPGSSQWSAAAVSPEANYVFLGNALYMVVKRDVQSAHPRVRFWGSMTFEREYQDLGTPLVLGAPARDWHIYFYGGRLTVKRIYVEPVPVDLVEDTDIKQGRLARMLGKGLISAETFYAENAEVEELEVIPGTDVENILREEGIESPENFVATLSLTHFVPPPYFYEGHAWTGTVIRIPVEKPINVYDDIMLQLSTSIHTSSLAYDKNKRVLALLGIPVEVGGGVGIGAAAYSKIVNKIVSWYASRHALYVEEVAAVATAQKVAKIAGVVGVAMAIWGGIDIVLIEWGGLGEVNTQNWIVLAPIVEDRLGNRYTAIQLELPLEESDNVEKYYDILSRYFKELGYVDVGFRVSYPCRTWDEYKMLLEAGYSPQVKLDDLIEETVAAKYSLDVDELKIKGVDIVVMTAVRAKETFWEWLFGIGGVDFDTVTLVGAATISVKGRLKAGTITDPSQIATLLGKVTIGGTEFELTPGAEGAYTDFAFNLGVEELAIDFGRRTGYFADMRLETTVLVKKEFQPLEDFGYTTTLHYDWEGTLIRIDKIEFSDMPYPMIKAERIFVYRYGNFTNDITEAFELSQVIDSNQSPTGEFYYYITEENTKFIDPANGGIMQPCKMYIFNYYYKQPPDVALNLYLNGTQVTSTKARHATVVLNSSKTQDVKYFVTFKVKRLVGLTEEIIYEENLTDVLHCEANVTAYRSYLIEKFVDMAIQVMAVNGTPAFVEITARITEAPYNYIKMNDEKTVIYYPPSTLVERYGQNATLTVYTYDAVSGLPIENVTITVWNETVIYTAQTNATGYVDFNVTIGLWNVNATATGYHDYSTELFVYDNVTFSIPLIPIEAETVIEPPQNATEPPIIINETTYWWLSIQVIWKDGAPFESAIVTVRNVTDNSIMFQNKTDSTGYVHWLIPDGSWIKVEVNATNPLNATQTYYEARQLNMTQHYWLVFRLPWISELFEPEVMLTSLDVVIHRGQGFYFGNVSHLVLVGLWTNYPQTVTLRLELVNAETNESVNAKDVTVTLEEGHRVLMEWLDVNASQGMYVRVHANITSFEVDTNLTNNELWSGIVFLKPMVDIQVFMLWRPVEQKQTWSLLPEDIIEIDIGIRLPINTTSKPAKLEWRIEKYDLREMLFSVERESEEELKIVQPGIVWRNVTIAVPWTSKITILASASHEWEDFGYNNYANVTIEIDPDVMIRLVEKPSFAMEGQVYKVVVNVTSNVEPGGGIGWISLVDNTTVKLLKRVEIELAPQKTVELEAKAPENPPVLWIFRAPTTEHHMTTQFAGYDLYLGNNVQEFTMTVVSYQWIVVLAAIIAIIAVVAVIRALTHTAFEVRERTRRFVKRRVSRLAGAIEDIREEFRFVRRKKRD